MSLYLKQTSGARPEDRLEGKGLEKRPVVAARPEAGVCEPPGDLVCRAVALGGAGATARIVGGCEDVDGLLELRGTREGERRRPEGRRGRRDEKEGEGSEGDSRPARHPLILPRLA
jgi:hypothetical protein